MPNPKDIFENINRTPTNTSKITPVKPLSPQEIFDESKGMSYKGSTTHELFNRKNSLSDPVNKTKEKDFFRLNVDLYEDNKVNWDKQLSQNQGVGEQAWNAVAGTVVNIVPKLIGDLAAIVDFEDYFNSDDEIGNELTAAMNKFTEHIDQESLPIYRQNPGKSFDFGDPAYWFENGRMIAESAIPFIIEGYLTGGVASTILGTAAKSTRFARALAKGAKLKKAQRFAQTLGGVESQVVKGLSGLASATMLNQAESIGSAMGVFDYTYKNLTDLGVSEQQARQKAAEAASHTVNMNRINILLNVTSASMFVKNPFSTRALLQKATVKNTFKKLAFEGAQEYAEETINHVSEQSGKRVGRSRKDGIDEYIADATSEKGIEAGFLGALGGIVQTAGTVGTQNIKSSLLGSVDPDTGEVYSKVGYQNKQYDKQQSEIQLLEQAVDDPSTLPNLTDVFNNVAETIKTAKEFQQAVKDKDENKIKAIQQKSLLNQAVKHFQLGTTGALVDFYKTIRDGDPQDGMDSNYKERAQEAIDTVEKLEEAYIDSSHFKNSTEVFLNRSNLINRNKDLGTLEKESVKLQPKVQERITSMLSNKLVTLDLYKKSQRGSRNNLNGRFEKDMETLSYDVSNLYESPDARIVGEDAKKVYDKFLAKVSKDPIVAAYLEVNDAKKTIADQIQGLEEAYYEITSPKKERDLNSKQNKAFKDSTEEIKKIETKEELDVVRNQIQTSEFTKAQKESLLETIGDQEKALVDKEQARIQKEADSQLNSVKQESLNNDEAITPVNKQEEKEVRDRIISEDDIDKKTTALEVETKDQTNYPLGDTIDSSPALDQDIPVSENEVSERPGVAYVSSTDGDLNTSDKKANNSDSAFSEFIEDTTIDKVGTRMEFVLDTPLETAKAIVDSGDSQLFSTVDIKMFVLNEDGTKKTINGKRVFGYVSRYNTRAGLREDLLPKLVSGERVATTITAIGPGKLKFDGIQKNPMSLYEDTTLYIGDHDGLVTDKFRDSRKTGKFSEYPSVRGRVYVSAPDLKKANGEEFPLILNSAKLQDPQIDAIFKVIDLYTEGYSPKDSRTAELMKDLGIENLTPSQVLDLLVHQSDEETTYPFNIKIQNKQVSIRALFNGVEKTLSANEILSNEVLRDQLRVYLRTIPRSTEATHINKSFNNDAIDNRITKDFIWFGKSYKATDSYNEFLFNDKALTTNIVKFNNSVAVNPWVDYDEHTWASKKGDVKNTKKLTATKDPLAADKAELAGLANDVAQIEKERAGTVISSEEVNLEDGLDPDFDPRDHDAFFNQVATWRALPLSGNEELYKQYNLMTVDGKLKTIPYNTFKQVQAARKWVATLNQSPNYNFRLRNTTGGYRILIQDGRFFNENVKESLKNIAVEKERFESLLPSVPLNIVSGLIEHGDVIADGMFYKDMVMLASVGTDGRSYHEAFHAVTQLFLTKEQREKLYKDTYDGESALQAEENLAEDFREYMLNDEKPKSVLKRLFYGIKELIQYFLGDSKTKLFRDIRKGRYAYAPKFSSTEKLFHRLKIHPEVKRDMIHSFALMAMKKSGNLSGDEEIFNDWHSVETYLYNVANQFQKWHDTHEEGDPQLAINFKTIFDNWGVFRVGLLDYMASLNLVPGISDVELSEETDENGDELSLETLNIKNALNYSGKDNASGLTKMLVSTLIDKTNISPHTGLPSLAPFAQSWRTLENTLSGMVGDIRTNKTTDPKNLQYKMTEAVKQLTIDNPHFDRLHQRLTDPAIDQNTKTQFVKAFSKQSVLFSTTLINAEEDSVRVMNSDTNNQSKLVINDWVNNVQDTLFPAGTRNDSLIKEQVRRAEQLRKEFSTLSPKDVFKVIASIYRKIGVNLTSSEVDSYVKQSGLSLKEATIGRNNKSLLSPIINKSKSAKGSALDSLVEWDFKKNPIADFTTVTSKLGEIKASTSKIPGESYVLGPDGNQYWSKSENNNMSKTIASWKNQPELLDNLLTKDYHKHSLFLKQMKGAIADNDLTKHNMEVFLSNRVEDIEDSGTEYSALERIDETVDRVNRLFNNYFSPLTFADKSMWYQLSGFSIKNFNGDFAEASETMYNYFLAEYERIKSPSADIKTFKTAKDNFYLFPEFNSDENIFVDGDMNSINKEYVLIKIQETLKARVLENQKLLNEFDLSTPTSMRAIDSSLQSKYAQYPNSNAFMLDLTMRSLIGNIEFTMMFTGDPAFYKDLSKRTPAVIATGNDLIISNKEDETFNVSVLSSYEVDSEFINDYESLIAQKFSHLGSTNAKAKAKQAVSPFRGLEEGDAQGYQSHQRFRSISKMLGKWESKHEDAYQRLITPGSELQWADLQMMQPSKGMHFELVEQGDRMVPVYLKYSTAVLWPSLVKGTKLESMFNNMQANSIDEVVFESGVKVGAQAISDSYEFIDSDQLNLNSLTLNNYHWKLQNELPSKFLKKRQTLEGSQVKKNIVANLNLEEAVYNGRTGRDVLQEITQIESQLSNLGRETLSKKWGIVDGKIKDTESFYDSLINKLRSDGFDSNVMEALEMHVPLDSVFQLGQKVEQELLSKITKSTVKTKMPGGSLIQISSFGFQKVEGLDRTQLSEIGGIRYFKDFEYLRGPRIENGTFTRGEVLIPHWMVKDIRDRHNDSIIKKYGKGVDELTGSQLSEVFNQALDGVVGYRIPNQGMSSIDSLEVVGILPENAGDSMVTYREITAKTGSDFDIDKMYVMLHNLSFNEETNQLEKIKYDKEAGPSGNGKKALQNRKLELYDTILMSPYTQGHVVTPLDSEWLKDDAYYLAILEKQGKEKADAYLKASNKKKWLSENFTAYQNLQEFNLVEQLTIKVRNMAGKAGTGQTANHLTHHALSQHANLKMLVSLSFPKEIQNGYELDLSSQVNEDGDFITEIMSAWLNAYVDNAKDPYISLINNNTKTANTVFMLLRAGVSPKWVNRFVSQPIVKDYVKSLQNSDSKVLKAYNERKLKKGPQLITDHQGNLVAKSPANANDKHSPDATEKFFIETYGANWPSLLSTKYNYQTKDQLEQQIVSPDEKTQLSILKEFIKMMHYATKLNEAVVTTKTDTQGTTESALEANRILQARERIVEEGVIINYDKLLSNTQLEAYTKNSIDFMIKSLGNELLSASPTVNNTVKALISETGMADNKQNRKKIFNSIKTFLYSGSDLFNTTPQERLDLIKKIPNEVELFKESNPNNPLSKILTVKRKTVYDEYGVGTTTKYVSSVFAKIDSTESDIIWTEWESLLEDPNNQEFANKLLKYSFLNSGFMKNKNSFFEYIPASFLKKNGFYDYMKWETSDMQNNNVLNEFINQYARHNIGDLQRVNLKSLGDSVKFNQNTAVVDSNIKLPGLFKVQNTIYRYAGDTEAGSVYQKMSILGKNKDNELYVEYSSRKSNPSSYLNRTEYKQVVNDKFVQINDTDINLIQTDDSITIEGLESYPALLEQVKIEEDGEVNTYYGVKIKGDNKEFDLLSEDIYVDPREAIEEASNILRNLGFNLIERTLKSPC